MGHVPCYGCSCIRFCEASVLEKKSGSLILRFAILLQLDLAPQLGCFCYALGQVQDVKLVINRLWHGIIGSLLKNDTARAACGLATTSTLNFHAMHFAHLQNSLPSFGHDISLHHHG